jgi:hypothetical protein
MYLVLFVWTDEAASHDRGANATNTEQTPFSSENTLTSEQKPSCLLTQPPAMRQLYSDRSHPSAAACLPVWVRAEAKPASIHPPAETIHRRRRLITQARTAGNGERGEDSRAADERVAVRPSLPCTDIIIVGFRLLRPAPCHSLATSSPFLLLRVHRLD